MRTISLGLLGAASAAGLACLAPAASAQTAAQPAPVASATVAPGADPTQGWNGKFMLYGWLPVINGKQQGPDGEPLVDLNANDVLSRLDMAFMGAAEIRKDRWGLLLDAIYVDLSNEGEWLQGRVTTDTGVKLGMYTVAAAYRVYEDKGFVDVYGGGRYFDTTLSFGIATDNRGRDREVGLNWGDPIVGVRGGWPLSHRWSLAGFGDVGGFDGASDLSWELYAGANYDFSDHWQGTIGYRYLSVLYQASDRAKIDLTIQGPLFGIAYTF
jgi:opacity protein-like surface antigen